MSATFAGKRLFAVSSVLLLGCLDWPTIPEPPAPSSETAPMVEVRPQAIAFEALTLGAQVELHVQSDGCFHHFVADAILTRTEEGLAIRVVRTNANLTPGWRMVMDTALTLSEVQALDRLIAFYRSGPTRGCTTVDQVSLRAMTGDPAGFTETYVDGSCDSYLRGDLFQIGGLFRVVREPAAKGAT